MMNKKKYGKWIWLILLPIAILLVRVASANPGFVETYYSRGIYLFIGQVLSSVFGIFPFSFAELIVIFVIGFIIYRVIKLIINIITIAKYCEIVYFIRDIVVYISVGYFVFICIWGLNYHRLPFSEIANIDIQKVSVEELTNLCESLIIEANELRDSVIEDDKGVMYIPNGYKSVFKRVDNGYKMASEVYPVLGGKYGRAKGVIISEAMSYAGITGIYFPFTGEANVNIDRPDLLLPATTCHEIAHQRGFAREDEANYIAYIVCKIHPDVDYKYSGTMLALIHSMNKLYEYDKDAYSKLKAKYSQGVRRDLADNNRYWKIYSGPVDRVSTKINNAYLISNLQNDGVHSYGRMVDLLIAERRLDK